MAYLVGVTGLAGAGKTTAVQYLSQATGGQAIYLGEVVLKEVRRRGLSETRENERRVRLEMRQQHGPAVLAMRYADKVGDYLANGIPTFVDAIFLLAEFDHLKSRALEASSYLLALEASFDIRLARLAVRRDRTFSRDELIHRDKTELETLGAAEVMSAASWTIRNEASLEDFYKGLAEFLSSRCDLPAESP